MLAGIQTSLQVSSSSSGEETHARLVFIIKNRNLLPSRPPLSDGHNLESCVMSAEGYISSRLRSRKNSVLRDISNYRNATARDQGIQTSSGGKQGRNKAQKVSIRY